MPHHIRLRTAWDRITGSECERVNLPDVPPTTGATSVIYRRSFNAPSGITPETQIRLVVDSWLGNLTLSFDSHQLAKQCASPRTPLSIDLRGKLTGHHTLQLTITGVAPALTGICVLEITER